MDKPKFNIMDAFIVLALVLVVAVGIFFVKGLGQSSDAAATNTEIRFDIQLTRAEKSLADMFVKACDEGQPVMIGVKERFEAVVMGVMVENSKRMTTDLRTGKAVLSDDPSCYDITITLGTEAVETDSSISVSGTSIRVGEETLIRGRDMVGYGFITNLEAAGE